MKIDFDKWNELKKNINGKLYDINTFPKAGEVWMINLGRNIGFEQNGTGLSFSRPVLVIKKFNNQMFWCVPLSTKQKEIDFYFNYTDPDNQKVSAILAQMRLVSIKRFTRDLYILDSLNFEEIRNRLRAFI
jgi:mRNA interferase MazF